MHYFPTSPWPKSFITWYKPIFFAFFVTIICYCIRGYVYEAKKLHWRFSQSMWLRIGMNEWAKKSINLLLCYAVLKWKPFLMQCFSIYSVFLLSSNCPYLILVFLHFHPCFTNAPAGIQVRLINSQHADPGIHGQDCHAKRNWSQPPPILPVLRSLWRGFPFKWFHPLSILSWQWPKIWPRSWLSSLQSPFQSQCWFWLSMSNPPPSLRWLSPLRRPLTLIVVISIVALSIVVKRLILMYPTIIVIRFCQKNRVPAYITKWSDFCATTSLIIGELTWRRMELGEKTKSGSRHKKLRRKRVGKRQWRATDKIGLPLRKFIVLGKWWELKLDRGGV